MFHIIKGKMHTVTAFCSLIFVKLLCSENTCSLFHWGFCSGANDNGMLRCANW